MAAGMHARVQQSTRAPTVARLEPLMVVMVEDEWLGPPADRPADAHQPTRQQFIDSLDSTHITHGMGRPDLNHAHYWHPSSGTMPSLRCTSCGMHFRRGVSMQQSWPGEIMRKMDRSLTSWLRQKFSDSHSNNFRHGSRGGVSAIHPFPSLALSLPISPPF